MRHVPERQSLPARFDSASKTPRFKIAIGRLATAYLLCPTMKSLLSILGLYSRLEEGLHMEGDVLETVFNCEVSGVQTMNLRLRDNLEECLPTRGREEDVSLPPEYDRLWLMFF